METEQVLKPSLMQRTRNFLKKKWVNAAGGIVLASALATGAAPALKAQEAEPANRPAMEFNYNRTQENATFMGVTAGDHDLSRNLDFVLEDYTLGKKSNEPLLLWVHEDYDWTNKQVIDEVRKRINNPDRYPMIEAIGTYRPMGNFGRFDARLDLEAIITRDIEGNEELFYTDPSNSNFYYLDDNYFFDWAFFPGRHITGFYYPTFSRAFSSYPYWDWDMDGIPNRWDMFPFRWDPWNSFMFDPFYAANYWHNTGWSGWNYWNYWGGPDYYVNINIINDHNGRPVSGNKHLTTITRDQLRDPNRAPSPIDSMKQLIANREAHRTVLTNEQLQQRNQYIKRIEKQNYEGLLKNPQIRTRDENGKDKIINVNPRDFNPDNYARITQRGENGRPDRIVTVPQSRIRDTKDTTGDQGYIRNNERNTERNIDRNTGEGMIIERNTERNTERGSASPPVMRDPTKTGGEIKKGEEKKEGSGSSGTVIKKYEPSAGYSSRDSSAPYQQRNANAPTYQPRISQGQGGNGELTSRIREATPRLIRPTPQETQKYSSPTIRESNYKPSAPSRSTYTPSIASQPRSSTTRTYSPPTIRSNPGRASSSSSYRPSTTRSSSPSRSYSGSSSGRSSSGSVRKK